MQIVIDLLGLTLKAVFKVRAMYTAILIPTDGSELAAKAVQHGIESDQPDDPLLTVDHRKLMNAPLAHQGKRRIVSVGLRERQWVGVHHVSFPSEVSPQVRQ